jgi:putative ABC transport system permease protein
MAVGTTAAGNLFEERPMMDLNLGPIFSSFRRNRTGALLVVFQVAIALAVLANSAWIVRQRLEALNKPTGLDDANLFVVSTAAFNEHFNYQAAVQEDLAYLRGLPGVVAAAPTDAAPFSQTGFSIDVWTNPTQTGAPQELNAFSMDEQGLKALGGHLKAGREFRADEIRPPLTQHSTEFVPEVLITQAAADVLYPGKNALGNTVFDPAGQPAAIVGIIENLIGSLPRGPRTGYQVALFPRMPEAGSLIYLVRTEPGRRDQLLSAAAAHLGHSNPDRVVKYARPVEQFKRRLQIADRNMEIFLTTAAALVLITTCLGISGLVMFNVSTRTRQIGTRRALGARRRDILRYFMVENGLLTTAGLLVGCVLALGLSAWLTRQYGVPKLNPYYLLGSVPILWVVGQLAAWIPARRATLVPPSVATRTL